MTDRDRFLNTAKGYIGTNGNFVCKTNLGLGAVYDWCAFAVSAIMKDCGFVGKYIKAVAGGAGDIPRISDSKYGDWFKKGTKTPQAGDLFFMRYADYPYQDKYFCDHVGIVESVNGNTITTRAMWTATATIGPEHLLSREKRDTSVTARCMLSTVRDGAEQHQLPLRRQARNPLMNLPKKSLQENGVPERNASRNSLPQATAIPLCRTE